MQLSRPATYLSTQLQARAQEAAAELAETKLELEQVKIQQQQQEKLLLNSINQADNASDHTTDTLQVQRDLLL